MDGPVKDKGNKVKETERGATYEDCKEICINDDSCNSFTYSKSKMECYFKDKKLFGNEQLVKWSNWFYSAYKVCTREGIHLKYR